MYTEIVREGEKETRKCCRESSRKISITSTSTRTTRHYFHMPRRLARAEETKCILRVLQASDLSHARRILRGNSSGNGDGNGSGERRRVMNLT